jgi:Fe-S-cluster-containing hydrogenase component 2
MELIIFPERCVKDHKCSAVALCPTGALSQRGFGAPEVDREKCTACGKCARRCPHAALVLKER